MASAERLHPWQNATRVFPQAFKVHEFLYLQSGKGQLARKPFRVLRASQWVIIAERKWSGVRNCLKS